MRVGKGSGIKTGSAMIRTVSDPQLAGGLEDIARLRAAAAWVAWRIAVWALLVAAAVWGPSRPHSLIAREIANAMSQIVRPG